MMEERNYLELQGLLGEFRNHLRITSNDLDAELLNKLKSAINSAEHETSQVIAASQFTTNESFFASIKLRWPVREVASVKVDGVVLDPSSYTVGERTVVFNSDVEGSRVEVVYTAGLKQIPDDMKAAIFLLGGSLFNNPTDRPEERDRTTARNLLRPYRSWGLHNG